jgi:hypothetical protein
MTAETRNIILITAIGLCMMPAGCDSSDQGAPSTTFKYSDGPSREECDKVKAGMTVEEAESILGVYGMSASENGALLQVAWCVVSCDPEKGDGIFIAHLDRGSITKVQFSAENKLEGDGWRAGQLDQ